MIPQRDPADSGAVPGGAVTRTGDGLVRAGFFVAKIAVAVMLLIITAEIVARGAFNTSLLVVNEFAGYMLLIMTFFGAANSLRSGALLRIEFVLFSLPRRARAVADTLFDTAALVLVLILFRHLIAFTWSTWTRGMVAPTLSEIPLWIPQIFMPVGCLVLIVGLLLELRGSLVRVLGLGSGGGDRPS